MAVWKRKASHMRKVKVDKAKLAVPDHGIPPRGFAKRPARARKRKQATKKAGKPRRKK